jgi:hypothetical protein
MRRLHCSNQCEDGRAEQYPVHGKSPWPPRALACTDAFASALLFMNESAINLPQRGIFRKGHLVCKLQDSNDRIRQDDYEITA